MDVKTPNLSDYSKSDHEALEDESDEFGYHYKFFKLFRMCLHMTATNQYRKARKLFYDSLSWFSPVFDECFVIRSHDILEKYDAQTYRAQYTYEQIEQLKYMRITAEFTRMLIDASSRNRVKLNINPNQRVEMVPVGFSQIVSYEGMATEIFNKLNQVQKYSHPRDTIKFFNHAIGWFGGIMDANFVMQCYIIQQKENSPDMRYRELVIAFTRMLSRKSITAAPYVTIAYKPTWKAPESVEDVVRAKRSLYEEGKPEWQPDFTM